MDYEVVYTDHVMHLTDEETDRFFDAFDKSDDDLPFYLHNARHRFIKQDLYDWLENNVGQAGFAWTHVQGLTRDCRSIKFRQQSHAMLFKLTFGGK